MITGIDANNFHASVNNIWAYFVCSVAHLWEVWSAAQSWNVHLKIDQLVIQMLVITSQFLKKKANVDRKSMKIDGGSYTIWFLYPKKYGSNTLLKATQQIETMILVFF